VGLGRGVAEHGPALGGHRGHEGVLGTGDAGLVQENIRAGQVPGLDLVAIAHQDPGAQRLEHQEVGVHPPAADDVTPGWREDRFPEPRDQRGGEQNRGANLGAERRIERLAHRAAGVDGQRVGPGPLHRGAEVREQRRHGFDVPDPRHIGQVDRPVGQQGRGENRERGILVARGAHRAGKRPAALNLEAKWHAQTSPGARARVKRIGYV
jgi:hypothetical protein